jgi:hypothetical protein
MPADDQYWVEPDASEPPTSPAAAKSNRALNLQYLKYRSLMDRFLAHNDIKCLYIIIIPVVPITSTQTDLEYHLKSCAYNNGRIYIPLAGVDNLDIRRQKHPFGQCYVIERLKALCITKA